MNNSGVMQGRDIIGFQPPSIHHQVHVNVDNKGKGKGKGDFYQK
jgi:hypothetical protein